MATPEQTNEFNPATFIEHIRAGNREFDRTDQATVERLDACLTQQLGELGLYHHYYREGAESEPDVSFSYIDPAAVKVIVKAFMGCKMPQPEDCGSLLFSERTALGRQAALDTALERIRVTSPYDITTDPDFYPEAGGISA